MAIALIDNATVSSVQRALGKAKLTDAGVSDVEQTALGRFCDAVLLSERVVVPDNYKEKFTPARKKLLNQLSVEFLDVPKVLDDDLNLIAQSLMEPWKDAYSEGQSKSLFSLYFEQIQAFSKFIWEHSSSQFFLVFRAHGIDKKSPLIDAVLTSKGDEDLGRELKIVASDGQVVAWNNMSHHVQRMLSVMGWLGHQYVWHQVFAAKHNLTYIPHPLRDFFANDFLSRVQIGSKDAFQFNNAFLHGIGKFQGDLKSGLEKLGNRPSNLHIQMPAFLPFLVKESSNGDDFMRVLSQYRIEPKVIELREMLKTAESESQLGNYNVRNQIVTDIERIGKNLLLEKGLDSRTLRIAPPTSIVDIKVEGDDTGIRIDLSSVFYKQYFLNRRYRAFVKDVMAELAAPGQYGVLKTKMNSWLWLEENKEYAGKSVYSKEYRFPSLFHKPLENHKET